MKKHIIIASVPRSGKSTISQKISNNLGYQHISMDSIIAGIEKVFPETANSRFAEKVTVKRRNLCTKECSINK